MLLAGAGPVELGERDRAASDDGRRGYHAGLPLVSIRIIQKVISTSRLLVVQPDRNQISARRGVISSAASDAAKTTALTQLGRTHERQTRNCYPADRHRLPVLYVTVPPDIIVFGYQHHGGSTVAAQVIRRHPQCSVLLARPLQPA